MFEGARQLLLGLGQSPEVLTQDGAGCSARFSAILTQFSIYTNVSAATPQGNVFCSGTPLGAPVTFGDRPYFQRALSTRGFAISAYVVGRVSGRPNIAVAHPAVDQTGRVRAVVVAGIGLGWRLDVDTHLGRGTTFVVTMPAVPATSPT